MRHEVFHMLLRSARKHATSWILVLVLLMAGCASQGPADRGPVTAGSGSRQLPPGSGNTVGDRVAAVALQQLGVPYRYGGSSTAGFDCSGLVHYAYARAGKNVPRTTNGLWEHTQPVPDRDLRAGDVLFFRIAGKMSHVGVYIGNGRFVHAPASGRKVTMASLYSDFYRQAFIRAGRP